MTTVDRVSPARILANTFAAMKELGVTKRQVFNEILRTTLEHNPQFLGVWSVWEPNALDGRDEDYVNAPGHDATGRYVPFWNRSLDGIRLEANPFYDAPGLGDWYLIPTQRGEETVVDPYEFPVSGQKMFITSRVAPIFHRGLCVGAAGIDIAVDALPSAGNENPAEDILNRGYVFLNGCGEVEYWTVRTRKLVEGYFPGEAAEDRLPAAVGAFLLKLNHRSRVKGSSVLVVKRRGMQLVLRFVHHPYRDGSLMLVEEQPCCEAELSTREQEVLDWIGQGKSNSEIAIILGISLHTVKRHAERIFEKLGVENRHAAALYAVGMRRTTETSSNIGLVTYIGKSMTRLSAIA
jgi:DNA-binding CsgD family transcriptional regulator